MPEVSDDQQALVCFVPNGVSIGRRRRPQVMAG